MTRREAISGKNAGSEKVWMGQTHVAAGTRSGDHHHGEAETAIYVLSGTPAFVFARGHDEVRLQTEPGDYIFVPPFVPHREEIPRHDLERLPEVRPSPPRLLSLALRWELVGRDGAPASGPGQRRVHARREIARTERLDDIVVGSRGEAGRDVSLLCQGRQEDDGDVRRGRILAEFPAYLQAGHAGHHDVKDGQVRRMLAGVGPGGQAVPEHPDQVTLLLELEGCEKLDVDVIFGQENRGHPSPQRV
jgi:hypothetical protein